MQRVEMQSQRDVEMQDGADSGSSSGSGADLMQQDPDLRSKVVILLSSVNKFYVLLLDNTPDGSGIISKVVGCHRLEEIKEVVIGIGLQVLSLEREQVELFDKHICRGSNMSIFLYSMLLFSSNDNKEESWLSRSLFVTEEYMFVCVEDFAHFSSVASDDAFSSYFILDSCCSISSISEMVIEPRETRCLTLTLDGVMSEKFNPSDDLRKEKLVTKLQEKMVTSSKKWKLKWFSEETLAKFVVLLKALHAATSISPLPVRCNS